MWLILFFIELYFMFKSQIIETFYYEIQSHLIACHDGETTTKKKKMNETQLYFEKNNFLPRYFYE